MRVVQLTEQEKEKLENLYKTSNNSVVRRRSLSLLLSNDKHSMKSICSITKVGRTSLYYFFNACEQSQGEDRFTTLSIAKGRGPKVKLDSVKEKLPALLKEHNRNLNPVLDELEKKYNIKVCKLTFSNTFESRKINVYRFRTSSKVGGRSPLRFRIRSKARFYFPFA